MLQALQVAAQTSLVPQVNAYVALQIKPRLLGIQAAIRQGVVGAASEEEANQILIGIVETNRRELAALRQKKGAPTDPSKVKTSVCPEPQRNVHHALATEPDRDRGWGFERTQRQKLYDLIDYLAELPSVETLFAQIPTDEAELMLRLPQAVQRLNELFVRWTKCKSALDQAAMSGIPDTTPISK